MREFHCAAIQEMWDVVLLSTVEAADYLEIDRRDVLNLAPELHYLDLTPSRHLFPLNYLKHLTTYKKGIERPDHWWSYAPTTYGRCVQGFAQSAAAQATIDRTEQNFHAALNYAGAGGAFLTTGQVGDILPANIRTVQRWIRDNVLYATTTGTENGYHRIPVPAILEAFPWHRPEVLAEQPSNDTFTKPSLGDYPAT